ncbi:hypothetical protein BH10PSE12_BH10PSE12_33390 [soil metagenome]
MVKPAKLYRQLLDSKSGVIAFRDFVRLPGVFGFAREYTAGSHRIYVHPKVPRSFPGECSRRICMISL